MIYIFCNISFLRLESSNTHVQPLLPATTSTPTTSIQPQILFGAHTDIVISLRYAPRSNWFITAGKDKRWVAWSSPSVGKGKSGTTTAGSDNASVALTKCERLFEALESSSILASDISFCGEYVVTGSGDNVANLYQIIYK